MKINKKFVNDVINSIKEDNKNLFQITMDLSYKAWQKNDKEYPCLQPIHFGIKNPKDQYWMYKDSDNYIEGYEEAKKRYKENNWNYQDMLDWTEKTYGKLARLVIQIGNYNYQVGNGGHSQYYSCNEYGTDGRHQWLCKTFDELFNIDMLPKPIGKFRTILNAFNKRIENNYCNYNWSGCAGDLDNKLWNLEADLIQWVTDQIKIKIFNIKF